MPIEVMIKRGESEIVQPPILPGKDRSFTSTDGDSLIVVSCDSLDTGGLVSDHLTPQAMETMSSALKILQGMGKIVGEVPNGGTFTVDISSENCPGQLLLRHYNLQQD